MTDNVSPTVKSLPLIVVPDSERLLVDERRAYRVEDLKDSVRLEVEAALALAHEHRLASWNLEYLDGLERQVVALDAEVARLRRIQAVRAVPETFPSRCSICGSAPTPGDGHRLNRWPGDLPEVCCPAKIAGWRVGAFSFVGSSWAGPVGGLRLPSPNHAPVGPQAAPPVAPARRRARARAVVPALTPNMSPVARPDLAALDPPVSATVAPKGQP
jgi:hypothetical protein